MKIIDEEYGLLHWKLLCKYSSNSYQAQLYNFLNCSQMYLNDCLNFPIYNKCTELSKLIDFGSIKDLQDFFPTLVKSIFGSPG